MTDIEPEHSLAPLSAAIEKIGDSTDDPNTKMLACVAATLITLVAEVSRLRQAVENIGGKGWNV